ncbi:1-aminocyclopropane-1-carboxylate oxidase 3 [Cyberlindnera jadinii NRRL Y-1542]|uniref:1-aminocyclopropane-1-carboxylate oxidase 3 n=1 Tax=Cyberlindnera jadinii (strain ATCC 18201 / CBS 1600 / BCRC 20928 / JCM 3617 / NBRC 0987 / NRRL Y-1542) TaxID=983966 RepID=A0A1E4RUW9_CYBJN|nr:1-aminocyclopropane-1-carboxylate oxidase 3 [Cyberlindnera jadinii NRRL Y-1542]ODV71069.1 1-aminocyclopropane-1-carboxylate oxidase 3 [Cyberlindnera jadinii NRRL Y-1542]
MTAHSNPLKVVDVSQLTQETADKILDGFTTQGFLFVDGHDFTQQEVDHYFELSEQFFQLPKEEKLKFAINHEDCGYTTFNQENLDPETQEKGDPKEAFNFGHFNFVTGDCDKTMLPDMFADGTENYAFIQKMTKKMFSLGTQILKLLAMGLKIDEEAGGSNWFSDRHRASGTSMTSMRMLHYPATSKMDAEMRVRAGAHTDYGSITLLFQKQGQEGLEIFDTSDKWTPVPFVKSTNEKYLEEGRAAPIVINIADQLSAWTNNVLKSTLHRVTLPTEGQDRYSIVFFFDAEDSVRMVPIPSPIVAAAATEEIDLNKDESEYMTAREYSEKRFRETYVSGH